MIQTLAVALVLAAPPGFTEAKPLEPAASFVAGKPVVVYCADDMTAWQQFLATTGRVGSSANGSAVPGSAEEKLSAVACDNLAQLKPQPFYAGLGPSILTLTHEAIHLRGETDEGITDCDAVHEMPRVAVKFFHVKAGKQLRALMAAVWTYRAKESAAYRTVC